MDDRDGASQRRDPASSGPLSASNGDEVEAHRQHKQSGISEGLAGEWRGDETGGAKFGERTRQVVVGEGSDCQLGTLQEKAQVEAESVGKRTLQEDTEHRAGTKGKLSSRERNQSFSEDLDAAAVKPERKAQKTSIDSHVAVEEGRSHLTRDENSNETTEASVVRLTVAPSLSRNNDQSREAMKLPPGQQIEEETRLVDTSGRKRPHSMIGSGMRPLKNLKLETENEIESQMENDSGYYSSTEDLEVSKMQRGSKDEQYFADKGNYNGSDDHQNRVSGDSSKTIAILKHTELGEGQLSLAQESDGALPLKRSTLESTSVQFDTLVDEIGSAEDPSEAMSRFQKVFTKELAALQGNSDGLCQARARILFASLGRSLFKLLNREEQFGNAAQDGVMSFFRFAIDVFAKYVWDDVAELCKIASTIFVFAPRSNFFKENAVAFDSDSNSTKAFFEQAKAVEIDVETLRTLEHQFAAEGKRLSLNYLKLLEYFCEVKQGYALLAKHISTRKSDNTVNVSPAKVQMFLHVIIGATDGLRISTLRNTASEIVSAVQLFFNTMNETEMRQLDPSSLVDIFSLLDCLQRKAGLSKPHRFEVIEKMKLRMALKQLRCPFMQQRLTGLKEVRAMVEQVTQIRQKADVSRTSSVSASNSQEQSTQRQLSKTESESQISQTATSASQFGDDRKSTLSNGDISVDSVEDMDNDSMTANTGTFDASSAQDILSDAEPADLTHYEASDVWERYQGPSPSGGTTYASEYPFLPHPSHDFVWFTEESLSDWLKANRFVELLFGTEHMHFELLKRSHEILRFLAEHDGFSSGDLAQMWDVANGPGTHESVRDTVYGILANISGFLDPVKRSMLWDKVNAVESTMYDVKVLLFVWNMTVHSFSVEEGDLLQSTSDCWKGLDLFWKLVQDGFDCQPEVHKAALLYLKEICAWQGSFPARQHFAYLCIENIVASRSVPQSQKLLRYIINTLPIEFGKPGHGSEAATPSPGVKQDISASCTVKSEPPLAIGDLMRSKMPLTTREEFVLWQPALIKACLEDLKRYKDVVFDKVKHTPSLHQHMLDKAITEGQETNKSRRTLDKCDEASMEIDEEVYVDDMYEEDEDCGGNHPQDFQTSKVSELLNSGLQTQKPMYTKSSKPTQKAVSSHLDTITLEGKYSHLRSMRIRMNFLRHIMMFGENVPRLGTDHVSILLHAAGRRALTQAERGLVLSWLMQMHYVAGGFETEGTHKTLMGWFREFPLTSLRPQTFAFFNYFFQVVNCEKGNLIYASHPSAKPFKLLAPLTMGLANPSETESHPIVSYNIRTPHLLGIGMLWSMALHAPHKGVCRQASELLCQLYSSMESPSNAEEKLDQSPMSRSDLDAIAGAWDGRQGLLEGGFIQEAMTQLKHSLNELQSSGSTTVTVRCLNLLNHLQRCSRLLSVNSSATLSDQKKMQVVSHGMLVEFTNRASRILVATRKVELRIIPVEGSEFMLSMYADVTPSLLKEIIATNLNVAVSRLRLITDGKEINDLEYKGHSSWSAKKTFYDGQRIHVGLRSKSAASSSPGRQPSDAIQSLSRRGRMAKEDPGFTPLDKQENIDLLTKLVFDPHSSEVIASHAWSLLRAVPPYQDLTRAILSFELSWSSLLSKGSVYKLLYTLEIVHTILRMGTDAWLWNSSSITVPAPLPQTKAAAKLWAANALKNGTLFHVTNLLCMATDCVSVLHTHNLGKQCILLLLVVTRLLLDRRPEGRTIFSFIPGLGNKLDRALLECVRFMSTFRISNDEPCAFPAEERGMLTDVVVFALLLRRDLHTQPEAAEVSGKGFCTEAFLAIWFRDCLLLSSNSETKTCLVETIKMTTTFNSACCVLVSAMLNNLDFAQEIAMWRSSEYFLLLTHLLQGAIEAHLYTKSQVLGFLDVLMRGLETHKPHESSLMGTQLLTKYDQTLHGMIKLLEMLCKCYSDLFKEPRDFSNEIEYVFSYLLFDYSIESYTNSFERPLCRTEKNRQAAMSLIVMLSSSSSHSLQRTLLLVASHHKQVAMPPLVLDDVVDLEQLDDFSVLHHQSCTKIAERELSWQYDPSSHALAECGYVGLRNLGCICYMNSLLQQLFMIPELRLGIMSATSKMSEESDDDRIMSENENPHANERSSSESSTMKSQDNVLANVQRLFVYLQESQKRFYDMTEFCASSTALNQGSPISIYEQQDVDEFLNVIMDVLEEALKRTNKPDLLRGLFGGVMCNQIICKTGCKHQSEREQSFLVCPLEVKGKSSIEESLELYVEGEVLEGENKYLCGECNEKRDAQKRACFAELPNVLILHLKRFEFDLEQMRKMKVNDFCEFPTQLDMKKYTREGLDGSSTPASVNATSDPYAYQLAGILVHTGTAESGHYYSYIKERLPRDSTPDSQSANSNWMCFNDETVSPFDPSLIPSTCFGGQDASSTRLNDKRSSSHDSQPRSAAKPFSAYLLVYERKSFVAQREKHQVPLPLQLREGLPFSFTGPCRRENAEFMKDLHIFSSSYADFVAKLVEKARTSNSAAQIEREAFLTCAKYTLLTATHATEDTSFLWGLKTMKAMHFGGSREGRELLFGLFEAGGGALLKSVLLRCPNLETRTEIADLLCSQLRDRDEAAADLDTSRWTQLVDGWVADTYYELGDLSKEGEVLIFCSGGIAVPSPGDTSTIHRGNKSHTKAISTAYGDVLWRDCLSVPCIPRVKSAIVRSMGWMLGFLSEATPYWKSLGEFLRVLDTFASRGIEEIRVLFRLGAVSRMADLLLSSGSPVMLCEDPWGERGLSSRKNLSSRQIKPPLKWGVKLLRTLVLASSVPQEPTNEALDKPSDGDSNKNLLMEQVQHGEKLTLLDLYLLQKPQLIDAMLESDSDPMDYAELFAHICVNRPSVSNKVISVLCTLLGEPGFSRFGQVFTLVEGLLEIEDAYHERRIKHFVEELSLVLTTDVTEDETVTASILEHISLLLANPRLLAVCECLATQGGSFWFEILVSSASALVRRNCSAVIVLLYLTLVDKSTSSAIEDGARHKIQCAAFGLVAAVFSLFQRDLLERFTSMDAYEIVELAAARLPRTPISSSLQISTKRPEPNEYAIRLVELEDFPLEPSCFHLVSLCRLAIVFFRKAPTTSVEQFDLSRLKEVISVLLNIDEHKVEADWNKGELIHLLRVSLETSPRLLAGFQAQSKLSSMLNISMTVRPLEEYFTFNEQYAPHYYTCFRLLMRDQSQLSRTLDTFAGLQHLKWAIRYFVLDVNEYERTWKPLVSVMFAVMTHSVEFSDHMLRLVVQTQEQIPHLMRRGVMIRAAILYGCTNRPASRAATTMLSEYTLDLAFPGLRDINNHEEELAWLTKQFFRSNALEVLASLVKQLMHIVLAEEAATVAASAPPSEPTPHPEVSDSPIKVLRQRSIKETKAVFGFFRDIISTLTTSQYSQANIERKAASSAVNGTQEDHEEACLFTYAFESWQERADLLLAMNTFTNLLASTALNEIHQCVFATINVCLKALVTFYSSQPSSAAMSADLLKLARFHKERCDNILSCIESGQRDHVFIQPMPPGYLHEICVEARKLADRSDLFEETAVILSRLLLNLVFESLGSFESFDLASGYCLSLMDDFPRLKRCAEQEEAFKRFHLGLKALSSSSQVKLQRPGTQANRFYIWCTESSKTSDCANREQGS